MAYADSLWHSPDGLKRSAHLPFAVGRPDRSECGSAASAVDDALGTNTALEIAETGKQGVLVHGVYDFWSPLRDYIALHNGLCVLTESASVNVASPIDVRFPS